MNPNKSDVIAKALHDTLISPNECDSNFEAANVVDGLFAIARALHRIADAMKPADETKPTPQANLIRADGNQDLPF